MTVLYNKRKFIFRLIILLPIFLIIVNDSWAEEANKYDPYPILFVHGYNIPRTTTYDELWRTTIKEFGKYFYDDQGKTKYFSDWEYCQKLDYIVKSEGDINSIADDLKNYIDLIVNVLLSDRKDADKKVVIVAHSSGGLVTRRFLAKYPTYQSRIERVVFIGTPHLGSPLASGVILIGRLRPELENALKDDFKGVSTDMGGEPNWQYSAYLNRQNIINDTLTWFNFIYDTLDIDPVSVNRMLAGYNNNSYKQYAPHHQGQGVTIGQLVVPGTVTASMTFIGEAYDSASHLRAQTEPLTKTSSYGQDIDNITFIDANTFAIPSKFRIIEGTGSSWAVYMGKSLGTLLKGAGDYPVEYSGLPTGNALEDLDAGDGIVTCSSQTAILNQIPEGSQVDSGDTIYQIPDTHIAESSAWQTILQAIEDPPKIEGAYAVPENWNATPTDASYNSYYLIFKVKDYLLADIEIDTLTIDGVSKIPESFKDSDGNYKPYNALKKTFLKERVCNGGNGSELIKYKDIQGNERSDLKLEPGEFSIKVPIPISAQSLYIKIKNPAAQYNTDTPNKFTTEKTFYFVRPKVKASWYSGQVKASGNVEYGVDGFFYYGYRIDVPPYHLFQFNPPYFYTPHVWLTARDAPFYFYIEDSPSQNIRLNAWLYDENFKSIPRKFTTDYKKITLSGSRTETLPDGKTQVTLYSGGFDNDHTFATWYGENDDNGTVAPHTNGGPVVPYNLKVTAGPPDSGASDKIIVLLGSDVAAISADPTFIQPSRREDITW